MPVRLSTYRRATGGRHGCWEFRFPSRRIPRWARREKTPVSSTGGAWAAMNPEVTSVLDPTCAVKPGRAVCPKYGALRRSRMEYEGSKSRPEAHVRPPGHSYGAPRIRQARHRACLCGDGRCFAGESTRTVCEIAPRPRVEGKVELERARMHVISPLPPCLVSRVSPRGFVVESKRQNRHGVAACDFE